MKHNWGSLSPTYVNSFGAHLFLPTSKAFWEPFFSQSKRKILLPPAPATCHKKCLCLCHIAASMGVYVCRGRNAKLVFACIDSCRYLTGGTLALFSLPPLTPHPLHTHTLLLLLLLCQGQRTAGAHLRFSALRWA